MQSGGGWGQRKADLKGSRRESGWYDDGIDKVNLGKLFLTDVVVSYKGLNTFKIKLYEFMTWKGKI